MLSEFMAIIGTLSPSAIYSALRKIGGEGEALTLTLRMLPPEGRPSTHQANRSMIGGERGTGANSRKHSVKLWTLRDCQMELLTEVQCTRSMRVPHHMCPLEGRPITRLAASRGEDFIGRIMRTSLPTCCGRWSAAPTCYRKVLRRFIATGRISRMARRRCFPTSAGRRFPKVRQLINNPPGENGGG
jgi:hypothetical protein